jgi:hypothetical protein
VDPDEGTASGAARPPGAAPPELGALWEALGTHGEGDSCVPWCPICRTADVLRGTTPPEILDQWAEIHREALLTLRAVIDHYVRRTEQRPAEAATVEEIPID